MQLKVLNLLLTTHCNFSCKNCSNAVPSTPIADRMHTTWHQIEQIARVSSGVHFPRFTVSGGEPTLSPLFSKLAASMREMFNADYYELRTNGVNLHRHFSSLDYFDLVTVGFYPWHSPVELERLPDIHPKIRLYLNTRFWDMTKPHPSKQQGKPWRRCYAYGRVKFVRDRLYQCCNM